MKPNLLVGNLVGLPGLVILVMKKPHPHRSHETGIFGRYSHSHLTFSAVPFRSWSHGSHELVSQGDPSHQATMLPPAAGQISESLFTPVRQTWGSMSTVWLHPVVSLRR